MASTSSTQEVVEDGSNSKEVNSDEGTSSASSPASSSEKSLAEKKAERMKKLRDLHLRRNEARKLNHQEVAEEDKRNKLPSNWEARKRRLEWELQDEEARKEAEARGEDYERVKLLQVTAEYQERLDKKKKKTNPDKGFSDYAAAQLRQYNRLTKQLKPDLAVYKEQKEKIGEEMFPNADNVMYGGEGKVSEAGIDRMVNDLEKQISKREKFSRRRAHHDDADIDYINERNMNFNKKLARYYDPYTAEIKQNLERGTAI